MHCEGWLQPLKQTVKNLKGDVPSDTELWHIYTIANGLIERMDIKEEGERAGLFQGQCRKTNRTNIVKHGKSTEGKQRYKCRNPDCSRSTFILQYSYQGYLSQVKQKISDMAVNGSGIRDTARVLKISPTTVIEELKKDRYLEAVNQPLLEQMENGTEPVMVVKVDEAECNS